MKTKISALFSTLILLTGVSYQSVFAQCAITTGPTNDCSYGDAIDNFTIGTTTATNAGCTGASGYSAHVAPVFNFDLDVAYPLTATVGGATYQQGLAIWIDLNNNGFYESTEQVYASGAADLNHTGSITILSTSPGVVTGTLLPMRVMCVYNQTIPAANACTSSQNTYGETEDYTCILTSPIASNVEATAVFEPVDNDCGNVSDSVWITVTNMTATDEVNVPIQLNLSGMATGTYYDTIPSLLGNASENLMMAVINSEAGGVLNAQLIVNHSDQNPLDDTLNVVINISNSTDIMISGTTDVCEGDSSDIMVDNVVGVETYTWYVDGAMATTGNTFNTGALTAGVQVVAQSSNACRENDTLDINITPLPTASFTSSVNNDMVDFTGTSSNADTIFWDFGDGSTGSGTTPTHTYTQNGDYTVCFYAVNQCDTTVDCQTVSITTIGIDEFAGGEIMIYPNPTHDDIKVQISNLDGFNGSWKLYNLDGKELQTGVIKANSPNQDVIISLRSYAAGTYIFKISNEKGEVYQKELIRN